MNPVPSNINPDEFKEGDLIIFNSVDGYFSVNGKKATIVEIRESPHFPQNVSFCIEYVEDFRRTWCRIDEMTKAG